MHQSLSLSSFFYICSSSCWDSFSATVLNTIPMLTTSKCINPTPCGTSMYPTGIPVLTWPKWYFQRFVSHWLHHFRQNTSTSHHLPGYHPVSNCHHLWPEVWQLFLNFAIIFDWKHGHIWWVKWVHGLTSTPTSATICVNLIKCRLGVWEFFKISIKHVNWDC